ncbi:MAG: hypothetical protein NW220_16175 [Leptolyngbyaceae cyanobacterium bins.349]|nr:hypothetical protein [Leptolyngbyaceae cyanobacterium bins.349]
MFKLLLLITSTVAITACAYLQVNGFASPASNQHAMAASGISVKRTSLIVREETLPPLGAMAVKDVPAKSAAVFVELENLHEADVSVEIQKIEIRNQSGNQLELVHQTSTAVLLRPLQISTYDFHLTQPGTFTQPGKMKAIITLKANGQIQVVESAAIAVQPY